MVSSPDRSYVFKVSERPRKDSDRNDKEQVGDQNNIGKEQVGNQNNIQLMSFHPLPRVRQCHLPFKDQQWRSPF